VLPFHRGAVNKGVRQTLRVDPRCELGATKQPSTCFVERPSAVSRVVNDIFWRQSRISSRWTARFCRILGQANSDPCLTEDSPAWWSQEVNSISIRTSPPVGQATLFAYYLQAKSRFWRNFAVSFVLTTMSTICC